MANLNNMNAVSKSLMHDNKIEPLDGANYRRWNQKIFMCLEQLELDYVLLNDPPALEVITVTSKTSESASDATPVPASKSKTNEANIMKFEKDNKTARFHLLSSM